MLDLPYVDSFRRVYFAILIFVASYLLFPARPASAAVESSLQTNDSQVDRILASMNTEERIGQLLLVTYYGEDYGADSDIGRLIQEYRIGGVVLAADHGNFSSTALLPQQIQDISIALQSYTLMSPSVNDISTPGSESISKPHIPLFITIEQDGSGSPYLLAAPGLTPLPSGMALGASWNPSLAEEVGTVVGHELSALGVNFLIGPSADMTELPNPLTPGDLGVQVYGSEPHWVTDMLMAYIAGIHTGSSNRMIVTLRHFPGLGDADRSASSELPTIRRSLDQLTEYELQPFLNSTRIDLYGGNVIDALMTGHIRILDFQGDNPRVVIRPIGLDPLALQVLLRLDPIATWRADGGLIVSDSLGARGVLNVYDPQTESFPNRRIAQDALLAGNDLLLLDQFGSDPQSNQTQTIIDTIQFFVQAYETNPAFQSRVDEAVRQIVARKLRLYGGNFSANGTVLPSESGARSVETRPDITLRVAEQALTLLSPSRTDLLPTPQPNDTIVIFTDTRSVQLCSTCAPESILAIDGLEKALLRLYGPEASAMVNSTSIRSYSFEQLFNNLAYGPNILVDATPQIDEVATSLASADWIVFMMFDVNSDINSPSNVVRRFLSERASNSAANIVVYAMDAPYYLDATEIGKLTAYYGLYGYTAPFLDVAAHALFRGATPYGASPVSVPGVNYDIFVATMPTEKQILKLHVVTSRGGGGPVLPILKKGDTLQISTDSIMDQNGHPVPDGTVVEFVLNYVNEGLRSIVSSTTSNGVAQINLVLDRSGELSINARSGKALNSDTISIVVPEAGGASIAVAPPIVTPTPADSTGTNRPDDSGTVESDSTQVSKNSIPVPIVTMKDFWIVLLGLAMISGTIFYVSFVRRDINHALLYALTAFLGGMVGYIYYGLGLPGVIWVYQIVGPIVSPMIFAWTLSVIAISVLPLISYFRNRRRLARLPAQNN